MQVVVRHQPLTQQVIDSIARSLPSNDPYLAAIEDHRRALVAGTLGESATAFVDGVPIGYSVTSPPTRAGHPSNVDIVTLPSPDATPDLFEALTSKRFTWWAREPRTSSFEATVNQNSPFITAQRRVMRMDKTIDSPIESDLLVRAATPADLDEIVRINNEAFINHPDRQNLTRESFERDLKQFGNRYEDLLLVKGGFCWTKVRSDGESEIFVLALDHSHQGCGLGGRLLRAGLEHVRLNHGAKRVCLYVESTNKHAISLYEHFGFTDSHLALVSATFDFT